MFRKYLSYWFHMINCCNPGVHYEKPCILQYVSQWSPFRITPQTCNILLVVTVLQTHSIRRKNNIYVILYKFESLSSPPATGKCNIASTNMKPCNQAWLSCMIGTTTVPVMIALFGYPDWSFSVFFPQLKGKCQGKTRKDRARPTLFPIN